MTDLIVHGGTLLTQDGNVEAEALAVTAGRIEAVGRVQDIEPLAGPSTKRFDLDGRTLVPGFNDAHVHVWKVGQLLSAILDLRGVSSLKELERRLVERHRDLPEGAWLLGRGYNEALMAEGRQPSRHDLDRAAGSRPVALTRTCGHMMVVNSRALELAGVDRTTADPPGGAILRDAAGEPSGLLQETAMGFAKEVMPHPSVAEYAEMVVAANDRQLQKGITSVTEAGAYLDLIAAYRALDDDQRLRVRANVMAMRLVDEQVEPLPIPERYVSDTLRVDSVKLFADGGLSGATAALRSRYRHVDGTGLLRADADALFELSLEPRDADLRICTHAIGDAAIDAVLDAYERLGGTGYRIEHFGLPDARQLSRAKRLGVMAAPQTIFIHSLGPNFLRHLTEDYLERAYPIRSMLGAGLVVALSSDAPVVPDDHPLAGIEAAVTRRSLDGTVIAPDESVTVAQALYAYTMGGAIASGDGDNRGSLSQGKWADMVVLDRNPLAIPPDELSSASVRATFVAGEQCYAT